MTGGELFSSCLANEGVEVVFGLPCAEFAPILAALDEHWIQFVPVRHPAAAVSLAEGGYRAGGPISAMLGGPRPDAAHLLPGRIAAGLAGVPLQLVVTVLQDRLDLFRPTPEPTAPACGTSSRVSWRGSELQRARARRAADPGAACTRSTQSARSQSSSRCVVCVTGDGAMGFHFLEMQSAARAGLAVKTVVCVGTGCKAEIALPVDLARRLAEVRRRPHGVAGAARGGSWI